MMLVHLLKLVWNRKRSNVLLMLEILAAFLVLFAVAVTALYSLDFYRRPVGFDYRDVWSIEFSRTGMDRYTLPTGEDAPIIRSLMRELESLEPVTAVAAGSNRPYSGSVSMNGWEYEGRSIMAKDDYVSLGYREVVGLDVVQGRWFEPADSALDWKPAVINLHLARELFGDEDPIGRRMSDDSVDVDRRVVGVVSEYRNGGEFSEAGPHFFDFVPQDGQSGLPIRFLLIKVAPGTEAGFEVPLTDRLHAIAPNWSFTIKTLESERRGDFMVTLIPTLIAAVVAGFLLLMVVLGLTGVMWQNVTRRTREIGLRRAVGACRADIHRQIVAEVMVTASCPAGRRLRSLSRVDRHSDPARRRAALRMT
jgi:putative ABC transport system permease protein